MGDHNQELIRYNDINKFLTGMARNEIFLNTCLFTRFRDSSGWQISQHQETMYCKTTNLGIHRSNIKSHVLILQFVFYSVASSKKYIEHVELRQVVCKGCDRLFLTEGVYTFESCCRAFP